MKLCGVLLALLAALSCTGASAQAIQGVSAFEKAKPAFSAASEIVLGRPPFEGDVYKWLIGMGKDPETKALVGDGVTFAEATKYLRLLLAKPTNFPMRRDIITIEYRDVVGHEQVPGPVFAAYEASMRGGTATATTVRTAEKAKLNASPEARKAMIDRAAYFALGRPANSAEFTKYLGTTWCWDEVRPQMTNWLYSKAGAEELYALTVRLIKEVLGKEVNAFMVNDSMARFAKDKLVVKNMENLLSYYKANGHYPVIN